MKIQSRPKNALLLVYCLLATSAMAADSVSGKVRNQTTGAPAAGDQVILLRLGEGMEEEAQTKTDSEGAFILNVNSPNAEHVVRVLHQGVNYDQVMTGTAPLEMKVFDAVTTIPGLQGSMGIVQVESDGSMLKITEMYAITNTSIPPVTQSRPRNFEISVPEKTVFDSVQAKSPGAGVWLNVAPTPVKGPKGRYSINFPLRPGDTLFKFIYRLPDEGSTIFHLKLAYPIKNFAVVHPPSMSFKALRPGTFKSPGVVSGLQLEQAAASLQQVEIPAFEISGVGIAKPHAASGGKATPSPLIAAPAPAAPSQSHPNAIEPATAPEHAGRETWLMLAGSIVMVLVGTFAVWRMKRKVVSGAGAMQSGEQEPLMESMKEELFELESERLRGAISAEEYASTKQALTQSISRILARSNH